MARLVIDNRQTQQNVTDLRPVGAGCTIYHIQVGQIVACSFIGEGIAGWLRQHDAHVFFTVHGVENARQGGVMAWTFSENTVCMI